MTPALRVEFSKRAAREVRELEAWWRLNRTAAPNAVREELERVIGIISTTPLIGRRANDVDLRDVRRVHISRIWHFLYYRLRDESERIEILSLWSESRGTAPKL